MIVLTATRPVATGCARNLAARGINIVLVGRRDVVLRGIGDQLESAHGIETRVVSADLSGSDFLGDIRLVTDDLDIGLLVSNAGAASMGALIRVDVNELTRFLIRSRAGISAAHLDVS
jgi:short-subunit dehydrogenase